MKVIEYLKKSKVGEITFIKARARKDANSPFYHVEYQTTPLFTRTECIEDNILSDYIILNDRQESITWLSGADWNIHIRRGWAKCLLVISPDDLALMYGEKQIKSMSDFIDKRLTI